MTISVQMMKSPRSGNPVANQFIIRTDDTYTFQSYDSIIAKVTSDGEVFLDSVYWDYSRTTSKYRNEFLQMMGQLTCTEPTKQTKRLIKDGQFKLTDLNA